MTAKEIYQKHYFKRYGTNRDNDVADWELEAMEEYAKQQAVIFARYCDAHGKDDRFDARYKHFVSEQARINIK